jgi:hypothetical protein
MPQVWVKDIAGQCVVRTENDTAEDVRAALVTAGLHVNTGTRVDVRSNVYEFVVAMPDARPITADNVRAMLRGNDDVEVMEGWW